MLPTHHQKLPKQVQHTKKHRYAYELLTPGVVGDDREENIHIQEMTSKIVYKLEIP